MSATPRALARTHAVRGWRERLAAGRAELRRAFEAEDRPHPLLRDHTRLADDVLTGLWIESGLAEPWALVAVGGFGRGELFPHSDVDILILLPDDHGGRRDAEIEAFVGALWDCGLDVGQSVRTVAECREEAERDVTIRTALLEARLVTGDRALFRNLQTLLRADLDPAAFLQAKVAEQQARYARFQDTAYNLEPNIKESPGGLRDLHVILWIARAAGLGSSWADLVEREVMTPFEARQVARHEQILQILRIRVHYLAGRREDRLLFDFQTELARELHLTGKGQKLPSERLMQGYYRSAKLVGLLNTVLLQSLTGRVVFKTPSPPVPIDDDFEARNSLLEARREGLFEQRPSAMLEAFLLLQKHPELDGMGARTMRALWQAKARINSEFRRDKLNQARFMEILRQPRRITFVLRRMNQYGALGRYLPEFRCIVGQMQHDLFHVYTVDAHILMVVRNLRRFMLPQFAHEYPFCSELARDFARPEVLIIAALFHDIAKGRGGDHSQLGALDARRFCRRHSLSEQDTELVSWLVEKHLVMSGAAQKQDLGDPDVIDAFARLVGDERHLTALYLLTVADIRGTSPKVWNAWKGKLLEDLYRMTRRTLAEGGADINAQIVAKQQEALRIVRAYALDEGVHKSLWAHLDAGYFQRFDAQDIAWHTRLLAGRAEPGRPIVKARLAPIGEGVQVLIYAPDQEALFARICGFFERISYDIVDARVYTTSHGYALDSFLVLDRGSKSTEYRDLLSYVEFELAERIAAKAPLEPPVKGRISRQLKHFPVEPVVEFEQDGKGRYWRLTLTAGDRAGLLSAVARVLVNHGVSVFSAKATTLGGRAEDVFHLSGATLAAEARRAALREDLLAALRT